MNVVEIYKQLPQKNCKECGPKTCMSFAISLLQGTSSPEECPYLNNDKKEYLHNCITKTDWRENLICNLKKDISKIKFSEIASDIGAILKSENLILRCMGRDYTVTPEGNITTNGNITPWVKILLLHYIRTQGKGPLTGRWISFSELKSGMVKSSSFHRECEEPLRHMLDINKKVTANALSILGAVYHEGFTSSTAWILYLLPMVPAAILYWPKEEEFDSKVKILFDSSADRFLDVESLMFLVEGLIRNIEILSQKPD